MKRKFYLLGSGFLLAALVLLGTMLYIKTHPAQTVETLVQVAVVERAETSKTPEATPSDSPEASEGEPAPAYESPVDFTSLWAMNPDIYAWLYIPNTEINYPILQRADDDGYYLKHSSIGATDKAGAVFTESTYNGKDFADPVTLVYGHNMRSGAIFGNLQALYSAPGGLTKYQKIIVYLPERELHYQVFAAVPFHMRHILYYNDFTDPAIFQVFLEQVFSVRSINASFDETLEVTTEDQLLILSTCLQGDSKQRYLVLAAMESEDPVP